jgi:RNA polymerase sigma-70 factor (ECF subfamily)
MGDDVENAKSDDNPFNALQNAALGEALLAALGTLPLAQREAFLLHAESRLSLEEIASVTGTGRETVKSRLRYAHRSLRKALQEWR